MKTAIYARVSKRPPSKNSQKAQEAKSQDPENQLRELREEVRRLGYSVSPELEYVDRETGTGKRRRDQFEKMLYDADHGKFKLLCIWALDRLSREGTLKTLLLLERLSRSGVKVKSLKEPWLDPSSPTYELLIPIFAWCAQSESTRLSDRIRCGIARAKAEGIRCGRRPIEVDVEKLVEVHRQTGSLRETSKRTGYSRTLLWRALKSKKTGAHTQGNGNGSPPTSHDDSASVVHPTEMPQKEADAGCDLPDSPTSPGNGTTP